MWPTQINSLRSITDPKTFGFKVFLVFLIMFDKYKKKIIINYFSIKYANKKYI